MQATFIFKPDRACGGEGVKLLQTPAELSVVLRRRMSHDAVLQRYISNPLLIGGRKWDARIYVLLLSVDPPRAFVSREGLGRFCTSDYRGTNLSSLGNVHAHLTNFCISKKAAGFTAGQTKRKLSSVLRMLEETVRDFTEEDFWRSVDSVVSTTILALHPEIARIYRSHMGNSDGDGTRAFHLLGFDVILDANFNPWLLEVNANPSLSLAEGGGHGAKEPDAKRISTVDEEVKSAVVRGALELVRRLQQKAGPGSSPDAPISPRQRGGSPRLRAFGGAQDSPAAWAPIELGLEPECEKEDEDGDEDGDGDGDDGDDGDEDGDDEDEDEDGDEDELPAGVHDAEAEEVEGAEEPGQGAGGDAATHSTEAAVCTSPALWPYIAPSP